MPIPTPKKNGKHKGSAVATAREVIYPELEVVVCQLDKALTAAKAKELLGWEDEPTYKVRICRDNPKLKGEDVKLENYQLTDINGSPVMCWNNNKNRPFEEVHARKLMQDLLNRHWAGPTTMPGETINGETVVISRTGEIISGQHRLVGLVLAWMEWASGKNAAHWKTLWETEPVLETLLVKGVSESPEVVQTLDNVKPRILADVFFTSELFSDLTNPHDRRRLSRMLDFSVDLFWRRTGAGKVGYERIQTHSTSRDLLDRHKKLLNCVREMFEIDKGSQLSIQKLQTGHLAACLYFMACSDTDGDAYLTADPRNEKKFDWGCWDKAVGFFKILANPKKPDFNGVRQALGGLVDPDSGNGGRLTEKLAVLAKAWNFWKGSKPGTVILMEDLEIDEMYSMDPSTGVKKFVDETNFGGIDFGNEKVEPVGPSKEDIEKAKKDADRKKRAEDIAAKLAQRRADKREPEEVPASTPTTYDADGKPPAPKAKPKDPTLSGRPRPKAAVGAAK